MLIDKNVDLHKWLTANKPERYFFVASARTLVFIPDRGAKFRMESPAGECYLWSQKIIADIYGNMNIGQVVLSG
jgi:S-adenosylmethionine synthetase